MWRTLNWCPVGAQAGGLRAAEWPSGRVATRMHPHAEASQSRGPLTGSLILFSLCDESASLFLLIQLLLAPDDLFSLCSAEGWKSSKGAKGEEGEKAGRDSDNERECKSGFMLQLCLPARFC